VLVLSNWPTTVPSSLTPLTWLKEYPEGAENVSKVQEAVWAACITDACKRSVMTMVEAERRRDMTSSVDCFSLENVQFQNSLRINQSQRLMPKRVAQGVTVLGLERW
jgi:hypothetical protein